MRSEQAGVSLVHPRNVGQSTAPSERAISERAQGRLSFTISLEDIAKDDLWLTGGKAANLAVLMRGGLPVPPGFCVTTAAFSEFLASCPQYASLGEAERADAAPKLSKQVIACLTNVPIPTSVEQAVLRAWHYHGEERTYAVRSSATVEDAEGRSFAGQFHSRLDVRGPEALLGAIKTCWLSAFSPRALAYAASLRSPAPQRGDAQDKEPTEARRAGHAAMAVLVQEMVAAEAAGVIFTTDPITGNPGRIIIEATSGVGDRLVSGWMDPEHVVLEKKTLRVVERHPVDGGGVLQGRLARRLGKVARKVERVFGRPQDIEWAAAQGQVFVLQSRPVTGGRRTTAWEDRQVWSNVNTGEVFPDVITPMTWSVVQALLNPMLRSVFRLFGADTKRTPVAGLVAGRVYFNATTGLAAAKPFLSILKGIPKVARALGGGEEPEFEQRFLDTPNAELPDMGFRWYRYVRSWPRLLCDLIRHSPRRGDAWTVRLKAQADKIVHADVSTQSTPDLLAFHRRLLQDELKSWDLLYLGTQAFALPVFERACRDWLNDPELELGYRLFAGLGGVPETEAALAVWDLAVRAHQDPDTEATVANGPGWAEAAAILRNTPHGRQFLAAWDAFMFEHGHRCRGELELSNARWSERPDYILGLVRGYLQSIGQTDPRNKQRELARARENLTDQCRRRLRNPFKRWIFSRSLRRAQKLAVNREEWKNQAVRQLTVLRRILAELGERLARQGVLAQADDIFFLETGEVEGVATGQADFDWRLVISQRRAEYTKNLSAAPPSVVVGRFDPAATILTPVDASPEILQGIPVYPGIVAGPARVILRTDDHEQVLAGEILVAPFTDPAWTPYFVTATGVVMERGGTLSHGSIVAREYGLPAVTNVGGATRTIRTGDWIQVDGTRGRVTLMKRAAQTAGR